VLPPQYCVRACCSASICVHSESAADGAAEGDRTEEQAGADGANDSIATGDMTIDSVRVHLR